MKRKDILEIIILLTVAPFILLIGQIDFSLYDTSSKLFWTDTWQILSSITGLIGTVLLVWSVTLGIRFFSKLISPDVLSTYQTHKWLGKYGAMIALLHPVFIMLAYGEDFFWLFLPDISNNFELYITYGRIAFLLIIVIWITSVALKDIISYRHWLYIHYLTYPILFFAVLHARDIGSTIEEYTFLSIIWNIFMVLAVVIPLFRGIISSGLVSKKHEVERVNRITKNLYEIHLKPIQNGFKKILPGQYFYLQLKPFGEAHPFSIMRFDAQSGKLVFGIKAFGKFTKKLQNVKEGQIINLDGPYGVFTQNITHQTPNIYIAGGIGVTPFIQRILSNPQNTFLFNCNSLLKNAVQRDELKLALKNNYYDFITQEKINENNVYNCRVTYLDINQIVGEDNLKNAQFYICGSKQFIDGITTMLLENGVNKAQLNVEEFY